VIGLGWKRLAGHVEFMAEKRYAYEFLVEKNEWQRPLGVPGLWWQDGRKKYDVMARNGFIWFRIESSG
jgi:hypothetical protein